MQRTGIFGGSFNPIHNGHIALAQQLRKEASLDEVWLMVSPQNPLKQESDLLADHLRFMMVTTGHTLPVGITGKISCVSMMWWSIRAMNIQVQSMQSSTPCRVRRFVNGYVRVSQWINWFLQPLNTWWWSIIVSGYSCRYQSCPSDGR